MAVCWGYPAHGAELTVLQTTDIHAFVRHGDDGPDTGGWLRMAYRLRAERRAAGADASLLVDCGDTVLGTISGAVTRGGIVPPMLKALNYDVWVPGNHELDLGVARLLELVRRVPRRTLCCNMTLEDDSGRFPMRAWRLFQRAGLRVAVIGAETAFLPNWLWGDRMAGYAVRPAVDALDEIMPEVHAAHPDVIILAVHQGWGGPALDTRGVNEVDRIARRFPEIDLILGGHTHRPIAGMLIGPTTWYVQAGAHSNQYARIRITAKPGAERVDNVTSRLITVGACPQDRQAKAALAPMLSEIEEFERRVIGNAAVTVSADGQPGVNCATSELLSRSIAEATNADVVFHGKLSQADLRAGPITEAKLFAIVPYENGLGTAWLTRSDLEAIIEEQYRNRDSYVHCGLWGAYAKLDDDGAVQRLQIEGDGRVGKDGLRRYRTAFNSYTLAGGGGRFPVLRRVTRQPAAQVKDANVMAREAVRRWIRKHSPCQVKPVRWQTRVLAPRGR